MNDTTTYAAESPTIGEHGVSLIGFPYCFGRRAGGTGYQTARGPEVLLDADAAPRMFGEAFEDVELTWVDADEPEPPRPGEHPMIPGDQMTRQLAQNNVLSRQVRSALNRSRLPVVIGGGCNATVGVVGGLDDDRIGLVWFDAHADAQTPDTSEDGVFEGMPVAVIAGKCWPLWRRRIEGFHEIDEDRIVQVGLHDTSLGELIGLGTQVGPDEIARDGFERTFLAAIDNLATRVDRVYVHIDTDVLDAAVVRANGVAAEGGISPEQLTWAVEEIGRRLHIRAVSVTSYDPDVDENAPRVLLDLMTAVTASALRSAVNPNRTI